jgi:hypothetical protein
MWAAAIVEQILSPCGALEYVNEETRVIEDHSNFSGIVCCQRIIPIPEKIAIKVPETKHKAHGHQHNREPCLYFLTRTLYFRENSIPPRFHKKVQLYSCCNC